MKKATLPMLLAGIAFSVLAASGGATKSAPRPLGSGPSGESPLAYAAARNCFTGSQVQVRPIKAHPQLVDDEAGEITNYLSSQFGADRGSKD